MITIVIDTVGTDPGSAFVYCDPRSAVKDARIDGRIMGTGPVLLETYSGAELGGAETFNGVSVNASSRRAAVGKMLRALGYPRGTAFEIKFEK